MYSHDMLNKKYTIVDIQGGFLICFKFGQLVKFGPLVWSSGTYYSVIRFLFIRSSSFGLMYLSQTYSSWFGDQTQQSGKTFHPVLEIRLSKVGKPSSWFVDQTQQSRKSYCSYISFNRSRKAGGVESIKEKGAVFKNSPFLGIFRGKFLRGSSVIRLPL